MSLKEPWHYFLFANKKQSHMMRPFLSLDKSLLMMCNLRRIYALVSCAKAAYESRSRGEMRMIAAKLLRIINGLAIIGLVGCLLTGCAHRLSEGECRTMDWHHEGMLDGNKGLPASDLEKARKDCARFDLAINYDAYRKGWRQGLRSYCTPDTGYQRGAEGLHPIDYCPSDLAPGFRRAWSRGVRTFCTTEVGYGLGKSGNPMPTFCPRDLAAKFEASYERGRAVRYKVKGVNAQLYDIEHALTRAQHDLHDAKRDKSYWEDYRPPASGSGINMTERNRNLKRARDRVKDAEYDVGRLEGRQRGLQHELSDVSLYN